MPQYTVDESDDKIQVCGIVKNETLERAVNFKLSTKDDSATSPADFSLKPAELQLNKMRSKACTNISIAKDKIVESRENFTLMMTTNDTEVIINTSEISTITITDANKVVIEFEREKYRIEEGKTVTLCAALKNATLERDLTIRLRDGANIGTIKLYRLWMPEGNIIYRAEMCICMLCTCTCHNISHTFQGIF